MLDLNYVRENHDKVREALLQRTASPALAVSPLGDFKRMDTERRRLIAESDELNARRNTSSREIGALMKEGRSEEANARRHEVNELKNRIAELDRERDEAERLMNKFLSELPNIPHESIPVGTDETANVEVRRWGTPPLFDFAPKDHVDLGTALGILDLERATKIASARFAILRGAGARLERALINFMLDLHTSEHGYEETWVPVLANRAAMTGTSQLPKFEDDMYALSADDLFLIPTAEVPLTNLYREEIIAEADLPKSFAAYSPCFRREAGSHGKDTRGLLRVHEFDKVELVRYALPERSLEDLELLTGHAERVLELLELPYRVVLLASGDTGFASAKTYDLEVFAPGVGKWLEVSSCSNFTDFQARRADIRYRPADGGKPRFVHTLNGSGVALPRIIAALLEHGQQPDGSVLLPDALRSYTRIDRLT